MLQSWIMIHIPCLLFIVSHSFGRHGRHIWNWPYMCWNLCMSNRAVSTLKTHWSTDKKTKRPFIDQVNLSALEIVMWSCRSTGVVVHTLCNAYFQPRVEPSIEFGWLYLQNNLWLLGKCNGTGIHKTALMASISISWYSTHDAVPSLADKIPKTDRGTRQLCLIVMKNESSLMKPGHMWWWFGSLCHVQLLH